MGTAYQEYGMRHVAELEQDPGGWQIDTSLLAVSNISIQGYILHLNSLTQPTHSITLPSPSLIKQILHYW